MQFILKKQPAEYHFTRIGYIASHKTVSAEFIVQILCFMQEAIVIVLSVSVLVELHWIFLVRVKPIRFKACGSAKENIEERHLEKSLETCIQTFVQSSRQFKSYKFEMTTLINILLMLYLLYLHRNKFLPPSQFFFFFFLKFQ